MSITEKQKMAIDFDGGNLLVSASAGSGKTFVMIERVKRLLLEGKADIDEILCVTFTVLAAREMKQKLADKLTESLALGGDKAIIERQLELLPTANISTIHAFCKNLLTEFFYEVDLDPAFTILDDKQCKMLANRAIGRLFEDLYEEKSELLDILLPYYFKSRSDKALKEKVRSVYYSLISEAEPSEILEGGKFYYTKKGIDEISEKFLNEFKEIATKYQTLGEILYDKCAAYEKYYSFVGEILKILNFITLCKDSEDLKIVASLDFGRKPTRPKTDDVYLLELDSEVVVFKDEVKSFLKNIAATFSENLDTEKERAAIMSPVYNAFIKLVSMFSEYFGREKKEENAVDYSDLEHLTLKLLQNEEIRSEISARYKYIFTDEYQDTSGVQEAIFNLLERDNLFMVGDVKQSIYDFRGCNPDIFADKFLKYQHGDGGTAISLDKNFRSTPEVLTCVNNVFSNIMTVDCGKVDYKNSPMEAGAAYPEREGDVALYTVKKNRAENKLPEGVYSVVKHLEILDDKKEFAEGRQAAELISSIVGSEYFSIKDNAYKTLDYGDITILLRNAGKSGDLYANELIKAGIPVIANSQKSIGEYAEIRLAVNILELLSCYNQDIPLAAVLKSPIGKLNDRELLEIRKKYKDGSFCEAFRRYLKEQEDELAQKLRTFDKYFAKLRLLAEFLPCNMLLNEIVRDNGLDTKLLAERMGTMKLARLDKFIQAAGEKGETASEFLENIDDRLSKITMDFTDDNAVKIMSIHASKGLEFPVVIMGGMSKPFNISDLKGDFLVDRNVGVALNYRDIENRIAYKTLLTKYVVGKKRQREREEEMRLFYVAMTRAKNKLYLLNEFSSDSTFLPQQKHGVMDVYNANNYYKMISQEDIEVRFNEFETNDQKRDIKKVLVGKPDDYMTDIIDRNLNFTYRYDGGDNIAVKRSVTDVAHFDEEEGVAYETSPIFGDSSSETGIAYHRFLEVCDFYKDAESEFNRLIGGDLLENQQKKLIEKEKIERIFSMPVFDKIRGYKLYKEQPFTCYMPAEILNNIENDENIEIHKQIKLSENGGDKVLIQGVIDLLAVKGDEAILIDYKHSKIKEDIDLVKRYKKQLCLYAFATEKMLNKHVIGAYLVNIYSAKSIEVEL